MVKRGLVVEFGKAWSDRVMYGVLRQCEVRSGSSVRFGAAGLVGSGQVGHGKVVESGGVMQGTVWPGMVRFDRARCGQFWFGKVAE